MKWIWISILTISCASPTPAGRVVEYAPFELRPEVDENTLLEVSNQLQTEFLGKQPGFLRRELLKLSERRYVDLVYWESQSAADSALQQAANSQTCGKYFQLMVMGTQDPGDGVLHLKSLRTYENP